VTRKRKAAERPIVTKALDGEGDVTITALSAVGDQMESIMKVTTAVGALALLASFGAAPLLAQTSSTSPSTRQEQSTQSQGTTGTSGSTANTATASAAPKPWYGDLKADALIGKELTDGSGETVGEIDDIVMQNQSQSLHAVVGVGGFLGLGEKEIAVPLADIEARSGTDGGFTTRHSENELKMMPEFSESQYRSIDRNRALASVRE